VGALVTGQQTVVARQILLEKMIKELTDVVASAQAPPNHGP